MWLMILIAVHTNNPTDIPGRIVLEVGSQQQCEEMLGTMTWWLKFPAFKIQGQCQKKN